MGYRGQCIAIACVALGFAHGGSVAQGPASAGTASDSVAARGITHEQARVIAYNLESVVEELRGLDFKRSVPVEIVEDEAARLRFLARVESFWPPERMRLEQIAYVQLGLWPTDRDLLETLLEVLEEQAGGFYDPEGDTFYVLGDMPKALAPIIMAHELTHALDDQHFDLDVGFAATSSDHDRGTAYSGVVEGSGTLVMTRYLMHEMQGGRLGPEVLQDFQTSEMGRAQVLFSAPEFLQRSLLGSYILGQQFLLRGDPQRLLGRIESSDLDRAFRTPPVSSEQLLHAEKYWDEAALDLPRDVASPDLAASFGEGWKRVAEGTLGELFVAILTGGATPDLSSIAVTRAEAWTNAAAAGWGGDRWQLYVAGEKTAVLLATLWDSDEDAMEFEVACQRSQDSGLWRRGDAVVLVVGATAERAAKIAAEYLAQLASGDD